MPDMSREEKLSKNFHGKACLPQRQYVEDGVHFLAQMKTRSKAGTHHMEDFFIFASGAKCGKNGIQFKSLWPSGTLPHKVEQVISQNMNNGWMPQKQFFSNGSKLSSSVMPMLRSVLPLRAILEMKAVNEGDTGTHLRLLAQCAETYPPAILTKMESHTNWVHTPTDIKHRIDYVMVPDS